MRFVVTLLVLAVGGCSTTPPPPADVQGTVTAAVQATVETIARQAPTPTAVERFDLAQNREGLATPVWVLVAEAYLAQYPGLHPSGVPGCTVPPFTDMRVVRRDVGFRLAWLAPGDQTAVRTTAILSGLAPEAIAEVASADRRCSGYVAASFLTLPH